MSRAAAIDRVLARVEIDDDGCWLFQGCVNAHGYGQVSGDDGQSRLTHRVVWEFFEGAVPDGLELDHLCRVTACCNPGHLEPVTHAENIARGEWLDAGGGYWRSQTHCKNDHEYTLENTHTRPDGRRRCRTCDREWMRAKRAAA
jgi:hypothetical protein